MLSCTQSEKMQESQTAKKGDELSYRVSLAPSSYLSMLSAARPAVLRPRQTSTRRTPGYGPPGVLKGQKAGSVVLRPLLRISTSLNEMMGTGQAIAESREGRFSGTDAVLVLDDGKTFAVHSALVALGSTILEDAVHLAHEEDQATARISLPSTSETEAQALVFFLYSKRPESYTRQLDLEALQRLARVGHRFGFQDLLGVVDEALAAGCGASSPEALGTQQSQARQHLNPENAVELYNEARCKGLTSFQAACAHHIAAHSAAVAECAPADGLGPVLAQVAKLHVLRSPLQALQKDMEKELRLFMVEDAERQQLTGVAPNHGPRSKENLVANYLLSLKLALR